MYGVISFYIFSVSSSITAEIKKKKGSLQRCLIRAQGASTAAPGLGLGQFVWARLRKGAWPRLQVWQNQVPSSLTRSVSSASYQPQESCPLIKRKVTVVRRQVLNILYFITFYHINLLLKAIVNIPRYY